MTTRPSTTQPQPAFLAAVGEMGRVVANVDWAATSIGSPHTWPVAIRVVLATMLDSPQPMCLTWGADNSFFFNAAYAPFLGARRNGAMGRPLAEVWPELWLDIEPILVKALAGEGTRFEDHPFTMTRNGFAEATWWTFTYMPLRDEHGAVFGMLCTTIDMTEKVLAGRRAQHERERQRQMLQQMPGFAALLRGPQHVYEYANDAYAAISGGRPLTGLAVRDAFPELEGQGFHDLLDEVYASGKPFVSQAVRIELSNDSPRFIDLLYHPIRDDRGAVAGIFVGGYDVSERIGAETALRGLNADLERQVIERAQARGQTWQMTPDLLAVMSPDEHFVDVNPAWTTTLGWSAAELISRPYPSFVHPDDLGASAEACEKVRRGDPVLRFENRYRCKDGGYRWLSWVAVPESGRFYCTVRDITDDKARESALMQAQEALRQAQKMEAVGQLTGGIAHDFNNLLAAMSISLQMLTRRAALGQFDSVEKYVNLAQSSVKRAANLTQRLLAFSRRQTLDPKPVDVNRLVAGMEELIRRTVGPSIHLEVVGAGGLWTVNVDAPQLESSLLNLCINARDAMQPDGGRLTVETANKWLDDRSARERDIPPGQYISVCVSDTGAGMSPEIAARAFDPFFTTKPMGQGTGLGLSMVYGFVRQSEGQVRIYSEPGQGTTMCMYFPRFAGDAVPGEAEPRDEPVAAGDGQVVLVIDDESTIRLVVAEVLTESGYQVIDADDGPSGLKLLQSSRRIDRLVTDVGLPGGMNGRQVADAARVARPGLKILFITGYAENAAVGNGHLEPGMQVLTKPFDVAALTHKVDMLLHP